MAMRLRDQAGPLIDRWTDPVCEFLESAADLHAALDWIDQAGMPAIDVADFTRVTGEALAAAEMAGRYDTWTSGNTMAMASASTEHSRLPFAEQIEFYRDRIDMDSETWSDVWQAQHDKAFMVAGAKGDLLTDLRSAVDSAIAEGTTIERFRRSFDGIVEKHGWQHSGGRDWRTRVIYGTNLRTSYAAGRFRQLKENAGVLPCWQYRHSHVSQIPRQHHLAWDGLVLRHDDPWWDTRYPPNGWGCNCYVTGIDEDGLRRLGKTGPDTAPRMQVREAMVGKKGPNPRIEEVPVDIDPGWAYAPGQSLVQGRMRKASGQAPMVAAHGIREVLAMPRMQGSLRDEWRDWVNAEDRTRASSYFLTDTVAPEIMSALRLYRQDLATPILSARRNEIYHARRDRKTDMGNAVSWADIERIPDIIERPKAVFLDIEKGNRLVYVFEPLDGDGRLGKLVFWVNWQEKRRGITNSFRTAGYVERYNLTDQRYVRLGGNLEQ